MARYATTTSQYTPFSFDAIWKASESLTQAHHQQAAEFAKMDAQLSPLQSLQYNPVDANEYNVIKNYTEQLQNSSLKFQKQGLRSGAVGDFVKLNQNYNQTIKPIETAIGKRDALGIIGAEIQLKDNTVVFTRAPKDIPLSEFMKGPVMPEYVSGNEVRAEVSTIASQIAKQFQGMDRSQISQYYDMYLSKYGLDLNQVTQMLNDPNMKDNALGQIINGVLSSKPQYNKLSDTDKQTILAYAKQGAYSAIGEQKPNVMDNKSLEAARLQLDRNRDNREQQAFNMEVDAYNKANNIIPPMRLDTQRKETWAMDPNGNVPRQRQKYEAVNEAIQKYQEFYKTHPNQKFTTKDLPEGLNLKDLPETGTWMERFTQYKTNLEIEGRGLGLLSDSYTIKPNIDGYNNVINNLGKGANASFEVRDVANSNRKKTLGTIITEVKEDQRGNIFLDYRPIQSENEFILNVPKDGGGYTQYKLPLTFFTGVSDEIATQFSYINATKNNQNLPEADKQVKLANFYQNILQWGLSELYPDNDLEKSLTGTDPKPKKNKYEQ